MATKTKQAFTTDAAYDPQNPNAIIINDFDYNNLKDEEWERYNELIDHLCPQLGVKEHSGHAFDFELYRAKPIFKARYPGLRDTPYDLKGIELVGIDKRPIQKTRMEIRYVRDLNRQIENEHSRNGFGRIYLLKKVA